MGCTLPVPSRRTFHLLTCRSYNGYIRNASVRVHFFFYHQMKLQTIGYTPRWENKPNWFKGKSH